MRTKEKEKLSKKLIKILLILVAIACCLVANKLLNNVKARFAKAETTKVATQSETLGAGYNKEEIQSQIFGKYYEQVDKILNSMTLEEKVGQMFIAKYPDKNAVDEIKRLNPCGYILEEEDLKNKTKQSILEELTNNQENSKIQLIFAVNEEGGKTVSVSSNKNLRTTKFNSVQEVWKQGQIGQVLEDSTEKSTLLKSLGINMNLVPVADVPSDNTDYMYERSYGRGVENTSTYVSELIKTMNEDGMISTMKHFPGYGNNKDCNTKNVVDERPYETFENEDFLPFKSGIEAGVPTILVSHVTVECMDKENPASLSPKVHKILREDLDFSGIIMTDDLSMQAVSSYVRRGEAAIKAVQAGNDIIISSDLKKQKEEVLQAVNSGEISKDTIDTAVRRILAWKYAYNII